MLAANQTKIVCTIDPASRSPEILKELLQAGMNIAVFIFPLENSNSIKLTYIKSVKQLH